MAQFFFNRHNGTTVVEPFIDNKYSKQDYYYTTANQLLPTCDNPTSLNDDITSSQSSYNPQSNRCGKDVYPSTNLPSTDGGYADEQNRKRNVLNNCLCKYKQNVDDYLAKTSTDVLTNGNTNDVDEKYNQMMMKNVNLGIGLGLMMIYIYTTNYQ